MKKLLAASLLMFSGLVSAAEIHISPGRLTFDKSTGVQHVFLTNSSSSVKRYVFLVRDVSQDPSGVMGVPAEADGNSLVEGVKLSRKTAELKPGQQIALAVSVKSSLFGKGEYDAYLQVTAMDSNPFMKAETDIGVPMSVQMNRSFRLPLIFKKDVSNSQLKFFKPRYEDGVFRTILGRKGDASVHGSLRVYDSSNNVVASINSTTILSTLSAREYAVPVADAESGEYTIKFEPVGVKNGTVASARIQVD